MNKERDTDREYVFHERINVLKNEGYRGFTVSGETSKGSGIELTAMSSGGRALSARGETREEALKKIINMIDSTLDERW